jgi:hypothetical protein
MTDINQLMPCKEIIAVYSENHTKHISIKYVLVHSYLMLKHVIHRVTNVL